MSNVIDLRTLNATWHLGPFAEVRVGEHVTRYVRRGSGPSVVLLAADVETNPIWMPLVDSLSPGHRLFIPQPPPDGIHTLPCLRGFVEGIGLAGFTLVAGGALSEVAIELTTSDDFTVRRLVLIPDEDSHASRSDSRMLVVRPEWSPLESVGRVLEFLGSESS